MIILSYHNYAFPFVMKIHIFMTEFILYFVANERNNKNCRVTGTGKFFY